MTASRLRTTLRWFHILVAFLLGAYFYSPFAGAEWMLPIIKFVLIPLLVVSGVAMWKQPQLMRRLRGKPADSAPDSDSPSQ